MPPYRPVLMPDDYYLARRSPMGLEIRDVMPFEDAITYVTDGTRIGIQFRDGRVDWFLGPGGGAFTADSYRLDRGALPRDLPVTTPPRETMVAVWRRNAAAFTRSAWE